MAIKADVTFSLKDMLFNPESVGELARAIHQAWPEFDWQSFASKALDRFPGLELKQRMACMVDELTRTLPDDFDDARKVLLRALPPPLDPSRTDDDFGSFIWMVPGDYIARHGLTRARVHKSLSFLRESTKRASAENSIRPFLKTFPEVSLPFVHKCTTDTNYHVRRLASEGIRPLLPWAPRADVPLTDIVSVLDKLFADPTRYVTRSVANTLNDISKQDPTLVLTTLRRWQKRGTQSPAEIAWMTRHSLRTLANQDHRDALKMLGFAADPQVSIKRLNVTKTVIVGENLVVDFDLLSEVEQQLSLVMKIHLLKANGDLKPKVFKVRNWLAGQGEVSHFTKQQPFRPLTTRTLYPGRHKVELVVNGSSLMTRSFEVQARP